MFLFFTNSTIRFTGFPIKCNSISEYCLLTISKASINGDEVAAYFEEAGYGFIYLPELKKKKYVFRYETGNTFPEKYIWLDGTYNVYHFSSGEHVTTGEIRMYGTQDVTFAGLPEPEKITITNPDIKLIGKKYDVSSKKLTLTLSAHDFQGETGKIVLTY